MSFRTKDEYKRYLEGNIDKTCNIGVEEERGIKDHCKHVPTSGWLNYSE